MMGAIRRDERRLLAGRPYTDPRRAANRSVERRLSTVRHLVAGTIVVAWVTNRFELAPVTVVAGAGITIAAAACVWALFAGGAARDRILATPAGELARRTAHVRALDETASVRHRPCRRELDLVMVATRPIDRTTRRILRREAHQLADRARRLRTSALHAGVAVAELPAVDGTVQWSARPQIVPGPDRRRWEAYDEAMQRISDRLTHIHRTAADLHVARQPALTEPARTARLDDQLAWEAAIADVEASSSAHDPLAAIDDRLAAEQYADGVVAQLRRS